MTSEGTSVSLCGWQLVCEPKARGASQRPLDTSGGTALTWLPQAQAQPVPTERLLTWATCSVPTRTPCTGTDIMPTLQMGKLRHREGRNRPQVPCGFEPRPRCWSLISLSDPRLTSTTQSTLGPAPHGPSEPLSGGGPVTRSGLCRPADGRTAPEGPGFLGSRAPRRPASALHIDAGGADTACAGETAGGAQVCAQSTHPRSSRAVGHHDPGRTVSLELCSPPPAQPGGALPRPRADAGTEGPGDPREPCGPARWTLRRICRHLDSPRVSRPFQAGRKRKPGWGPI